MLRAFRYAGSKQYLISYINALLPENSEEYTYIEPFLGSGAIFYNLSKDFKHYQLSDMCEYIIALHSCFTRFNYSDYAYMLENIKETYGDIKIDKDAYYKFRNHYNCDTGGFKDLKLFMLANSCINSLLRFGPNGMNQSFGHRHYIVTENDWNAMQSKLREASLVKANYLSLLIDSNTKCFIYLDPPYDTKWVDYSYYYFDSDEYVPWLISISKPNVKIAYSDIDEHWWPKLEQVGWKRVPVKELRNCNPNSSREITMHEYLYTFNI